MGKTNIPGSIIVTLVLLALVGYAVSRVASPDSNWNLFFSLLGSIAVIAIVPSILAIGGDKA